MFPLEQEYTLPLLSPPHNLFQPLLCYSVASPPMPCQPNVFTNLPPTSTHFLWINIGSIFYYCILRLDKLLPFEPMAFNCVTCSILICRLFICLIHLLMWLYILHILCITFSSVCGYIKAGELN